jgi:hypothetical protein
MKMADCLAHHCSQQRVLHSEAWWDLQVKLSFKEERRGQHGAQTQVPAVGKLPPAFLPGFGKEPKGLMPLCLLSFSPMTASTGGNLPLSRAPESCRKSHLRWWVSHQARVKLQVQS